MKQVSSTLLVLSLFTTLAFLGACGDKCPDCPQNAECNQDKCACLPDYWSFNGSCVSLDSNSYVGANPACYCYDTLAFSIHGQGELRQITTPMRSGNSVASLTQGIFYYELPSGDSIYFPEMDLRCFNENDEPMKPAIYGKQLPNGNWFIRLEFKNPFTGAFIDDCTMVMRRFE